MNNKKKIFILAGIVFIILVAAAFFLLRPGFTPSGQDKRAIELALGDEGKALTVHNEFRISFDYEDLSVHEGVDPNWTHILLLGTDTTNDQLNDGRSDAMLIASVNTKTKGLKLTSLARDMLINIPVLKSRHRINTANAYGGPLLAVKTVNELLGLNITRYVSINFASIIGIVDLMGGVDVVLSEDEARIIRVSPSDEPRTLNGLKAMTYARIRKIDNNFGRNERQRKLLASMLEKAKGMKAHEALTLLPEVLKLVSTNLTTSEILSLMPVVLGSTQGMDMLSLPPDKGYRYGNDNGASVLIVNPEKMRDAFDVFMDRKPVPEQTEE